MISPLLIAKVFGATSSLAAAAVGAAFGIGSIISDNKQTKPPTVTPPTPQQRYAAYGARLTANPKPTAKAVVVKSSSLPADSSLQLTTP